MRRNVLHWALITLHINLSGCAANLPPPAANAPKITRTGEQTEYYEVWVRVPDHELFVEVSLDQSTTHDGFTGFRPVQSSTYRCSPDCRTMRQSFNGHQLAYHLHMVGRHAAIAITEEYHVVTLGHCFQIVHPNMTELSCQFSF